MISSQRGGLGSVGQVMNYHADTMDYTRTVEGLENELTPSEWFGKGAELAGLSGSFEYDALKATLEGKVNGQQIPSGWDKANAPKHLPGWDFTFSPGRSVSYVALVSGDDRVMAAHVLAVKTALEHAQANGVTMRAYEDGKRVERKGDNLTVGMAHHTVNRDGEPHIHTHALIMNMVYDGIDDKWRALDIQKIGQMRVTQELDRVYQSALGRNLEMLGFQITQTPTAGSKFGIEIAGVPRDLMLKFDQRRFGENGIVGNLKRKGKTLENASSRDKQLSNFESRKDKVLVRDDLPQMSRAQYQEKWQAQSREWGVEPTQFSMKMPELPSLSKLQPTEQAVQNALEKVIDRMHDALADVQKLTRAQHAVREANDLPRMAIVAQELQAARAVLAPKSLNEITAAIRAEPGMSFATKEHIKEAVEMVAEMGWLHTHGKDKFSIETPRAAELRNDMAKAADRGYLQFQSNMALANAVYAHAMGPTRADYHQARAVEAFSKGDKDNFLLEAGRMQDARPTISKAALTNAILADVPKATLPGIDHSLARAHAAGSLHPTHDNALEFSLESSAQIKERNHLQQDALVVTFDNVLAHQAKALDRVDALTAALKVAVEAERKQAIQEAAMKVEGGQSGHHSLYSDEVLKQSIKEVAMAFDGKQPVAIPASQVKDSLRFALEGGKFDSVAAVADAVKGALADKDPALADAAAASILKSAQATDLTPKAVVAGLTNVIDYQSAQADKLAGQIERKLEGKQTSAEIANELRLVSGQVAHTREHWGEALQNEAPQAQEKEIATAIQEAVATGKLHSFKVKGEEVLTVESEAQSNTRRLTEKAAYSANKELGELMGQYELAATARDRVIAKMATAAQEVKSLTSELNLARAQRNDKKIESLKEQLKKPTLTLGGLSAAGFDSAVRKEIAELAKERDANNPKELSLGDSREQALQDYVSKLTAAQGMSSIHPPQKENAKSVFISNDVLAAVREEAINQGRLHINADRVSVESELTANGRLDGAREAAQAYRDAVASDRKTEFKTKIAEQREMRTAEALANKAERIAGMTAEQRKWAEHPLREKSMRNISKAAWAITSPRLAAKRLAIDTVKSATVQAFTLGETAVKVLAAGVVSAAATPFKGRDAVFAQAKGERLSLGMKVNASNISSLGFHVTAGGDVYRMNINVQNALLTASIKLLGITMLSRTGIGMAMQNELLKNISTKRIDGLEAWAAKQYIAATREITPAVKDTVRAGIQAAVQPLKALSKEERFGKQFASAALAYRTAKEEFRVGLRDEQGFREAHATFAKVVAKGIEVNDGVLDRALTSYDKQTRQIGIDVDVAKIAHNIRESNEQVKEAGPDLKRYDEKTIAANNRVERALQSFRTKDSALRAALPSADAEVKAINMEVKLKAAVLEHKDQGALHRLGAVSADMVKESKLQLEKLKNLAKVMPQQQQQDYGMSRAMGVSARDYRIQKRDALAPAKDKKQQTLEKSAQADRSQSTTKKEDWEMDKSSSRSKSQDRSRDSGLSM